MGFYPFAPPVPITAIGYDVVTGFGADPTGIIDSTANFQAAINAAIAAPAGQVTIPAGKYNLNTGNINISGPFRMVGLGSGWTYFNSSSTSPGVLLNCNGGAGGTQPLFTFSQPSGLWGGMEHQGVSIAYSGTGNVYHQVNFADSVFRDMQITMTQSAGSAIFCSGSNSYLNIYHDRVQITTTNAVRSAPMISISSSIGAGISNNTWFKCKFSNKGLDNTQYMVFVQCTGAGSAYHFADNMLHCWFEHPFGGAYKSLSGQNITIDSCSIWDIQGGQGVTVGASCFYHGAAAGNSGSQGIRMINCSRNLNGPDGAATWDIECESTTSNVGIDNYQTSPLNVSTTYNVFFNFHGCNDVTITNTQSPQGANVNGNSDTLITNPSPTQVLLKKGVITPLPTGLFQPSDATMLAWNYDPAIIGTAVGATSGTVQVISVNVRNQITFNNVVLFQAAAGTGLVAAQNFAGLYTSAGVQVAVTPDQSGVWNAGTNVFKVMAVTGAPFTIAPGLYFILLLSNQAAGSTPTWGRAQNFVASSANANLVAASSRFGTGSAAQTVLPASFTPSTYITQTQLEFWVGLS